MCDLPGPGINCGPDLLLGVVPKTSFLPDTMTSLLLSRSVVSDSLQLHGLQHARLPCPLPSLRVCSNSCPLSQWCHPTILSSVVPFSSCPQSFPASESFPMSQFFASGGQTIEASGSVSVLLMNTKGWFPLGLTGLISLWLGGCHVLGKDPHFIPSRGASLVKI